jgi:hypothetical protein
VDPVKAAGARVVLDPASPNPQMAKLPESHHLMLRGREFRRQSGRCPRLCMYFMPKRGHLGHWPSMHAASLPLNTCE